ncbi:MAG TPA: SAM-dependent methyltransferase [bacterium]|jgi:SAM-dependent methyltransferase
MAAMNAAQVYRRVVRNAVADADRFTGGSFSGRRRGFQVPWEKVGLRPIQIKGRRHVQITYERGPRAVAKNFAGARLDEEIARLLDLPYGIITVNTADRRIQVRINRKGHASIHETAIAAPAAVDLAHDRRKQYLLGQESSAFLRALGMVTPSGEIKAGMRDKFQQIHEFLKLLEHSGALQPAVGRPLVIADLGCGSAHLTFAAYHYVRDVLGIPSQMIGVDRNVSLLEKQRSLARRLGMPEVTFVTTAIEDFVPTQPIDIVLALHACDTATDDAVAQGIRWRSRGIFSVPCCHHDLQAQLERRAPPAAFAPVWRDGILGSRTADILTDTFRALILRIMGYRTDVVEFVASEHTARNLMIRAVRAAGGSDIRHLREYQQLTQFWGVTPYLERALGETFQRAPRTAV